MSENIRFTLPATWSDYQGAVDVLVGANERKLMHESAELTVSALPGSTLRTVQGAAHDIPFSQPGIIASTLLGQIIGFTAGPRITIDHSRTSIVSWPNSAP